MRLSCTKTLKYLMSEAFSNLIGENSLATYVNAKSLYCSSLNPCGLADPIPNKVKFGKFKILSKDYISLSKSFLKPDIHLYFLNELQ